MQTGFPFHLSMQKILLILSLFISFILHAQDTLPEFTVMNKGNNRFLISWYNKYVQTKQISIQRSADSLTNFKTILTVPDPMNRQNGYLDTKAPAGAVFYRLYILIDGSHFVFSKSRRAPTDTGAGKSGAAQSAPKPDAELDSTALAVLEKISSQKIPDSMLSEEERVLLKRIKNSQLDRLPDSISRKLDAVLRLSAKPAIVIPVYHVVTTREGLVQIRLSDFQQKKYSLRFFEEDDTFLFEIKNIREAFLLLDKSNFHHSGWFKSELYEDGKLVEKSQFFIPKDF